VELVGEHPILCDWKDSGYLRKDNINSVCRETRKNWMNKFKLICSLYCNYFNNLNYFNWKSNQIYFHNNLSLDLRSLVCLFCCILAVSIHTDNFVKLVSMTLGNLLLRNLSFIIEEIFWVRKLLFSNKNKIMQIPCMQLGSLSFHNNTQVLWKHKTLKQASHRHILHSYDFKKLYSWKYVSC
jgi:hypothetical protein